MARRRSTPAPQPTTKRVAWEKLGDDCIRVFIPEECRAWWTARCEADHFYPDLDENGQTSFNGLESTEWCINTMAEAPKGCLTLIVCYRHWAV